MMLARRLVPETNSYRLDVLKECFRLGPTQSHRAKNDVLAVVELFQKVFQPRLESVGLNTFESVAEFARRTPVAKCLDLVRRGSKPSAPPPQFKDEWYYLDAANNAHGPLPAREVDESAGLEAYYVYREGMSDWVVNRECPEFLSLRNSPPRTVQPVRRFESAKTMEELVGICRGMIADAKLTTAEVMYLHSWMQDAGFISEWPASEIAQTLERILEDGVVTKEEKEELKRLIHSIVS
jgi:hypothetical protein